jgi:hypothetical protein
MIRDVGLCGHDTLSFFRKQCNGRHERGVMRGQRQDMMILLTPGVLLMMFRTLTTTSAAASNRLPCPNPTAASIPFTRKSLTAIRAALTRAAQDYTPITADPKEGHAAVLIPLCNVNDQPGILLELRGKLRTHSGEVRYGLSC